MRTTAFLVVLWCCSRAPGNDLRFVDPGPSSSAAVVVADHLPLLHTAQILPRKGSDTPENQVREVLATLDTILKEHGADRSRVVKLNAALRDAATAPILERALAGYFTGNARAAVSLVVGKLSATVAIDAVAALAEDPKLTKVRITPTGAVLPTGSRLWVSGQAVSGGGDVARATRLTMESLERTLQSIRLKNDAVVQLKAFVHPMSQADVARKEMERFFGTNPVPPIVFVEWQSNNSIEIELIAHGGREGAGWPVEFLATPELKPSPVYSQVARVPLGPLIYIGGLHPERSGDPEGEIVEVFERLASILDQTGSNFLNLVKATYYVTDAETVKKMRELRPRWFVPDRPPAASLAMTTGTGRPGKHVTLDMIAALAPDREINPYGPPTHGFGMGPPEAFAGWLSLFDGKTTVGWKEGRVENGVLVAGTTTSAFGPCEYRVELAGAGTLRWGTTDLKITGNASGTLEPDRPAPIELVNGVAVKKLMIRPVGLRSLFNHKDLTGWKQIHHPRLPEDRRAKWTVKEGMIRAVGGPGALEYEGELFGDFILQVKVKTLLRHSNGGLFLRSIPGDFMNGYEAQIYTRCIAGDPTRPAVWATGAIDDRQNARMLVNRDGIPFKLTVLAQGAHLATWVNGNQTVDWTDTRPPHANPRQGLRLEPGSLQLQAHDVATDEEFRAIAIRKW